MTTQPPRTEEEMDKLVEMIGTTMSAFDARTFYGMLAALLQNRIERATSDEVRAALRHMVVQTRGIYAQVQHDVRLMQEQAREQASAAKLIVPPGVSR